MEFPNDPTNNIPLTDEELDSLPINFGKWKNLTPIQISELPNKRDREYIIWAYENVERRDRPVFCSAALYRSEGGKFKSAKEQRLEKEAAKSKNHPYNPVIGDDLDDDIPF